MDVSLVVNPLALTATSANLNIEIYYPNSDLIFF